MFCLALALRSAHNFNIVLFNLLVPEQLQQNPLTTTAITTAATTAATAAHRWMLDTVHNSQKISCGCRCRETNDPGHLIYFDRILNYVYFVNLNKQHSNNFLLVSVIVVVPPLLLSNTIDQKWKPPTRKFKRGILSLMEKHIRSAKRPTNETMNEKVRAKNKSDLITATKVQLGLVTGKKM